MTQYKTGLVFPITHQKEFLKGLKNLFPKTLLSSHNEFIPGPSPVFVQSSEPLFFCSLSLLSMKACFLVATTSVRKVSELIALNVDKPFIHSFYWQGGLMSQCQVSPKSHFRFPLISITESSGILPKPIHGSRESLTHSGGSYCFIILST